MDTLRHSGSIVINRSPEEVYALISDVTNMGAWSPVCKACWWDEGDGPRIGAMFTGRNEAGDRTWETRSEVLAADPGKEFAWVIAEPPTRARWGYTFKAVDGGTEVTESWELPPEGQEFFEQRIHLLHILLERIESSKPVEVLNRIAFCTGQRHPLDRSAQFRER